MAQKNKGIELNEVVTEEIQRLGELHEIETAILKEFATFVIKNHRKKKKPDKKVRFLTVKELKAAVYQYFNVKDTQELKKSGRYKLATNDLGKLNLGRKEAWELLYRKYVDILPEEKGETGKDCINGINIFKYFRPWDVFGLDPQSATTEEIKGAYRRLSKIYHPDIPETGDARIFDRLTVMYESLTVKV